MKERVKLEFRAWACLRWEGNWTRPEWSCASDAFSLLPKVKWAQSCRSVSCTPNPRRTTQQVSHAWFLPFFVNRLTWNLTIARLISYLFYRKHLESTRLQYEDCSVCVYMYISTLRHKITGRRNAKMGEGGNGSCSLFVFHLWNHNSKRRGLRKHCTVKSHDYCAKCPEWSGQQFPARFQHSKQESITENTWDTWTL